jgi:hypothetical protein
LERPRGCIVLRNREKPDECIPPLHLACGWVDNGDGELDRVERLQRLRDGKPAARHQHLKLGIAGQKVREMPLGESRGLD